MDAEFYVHGNGWLHRLDPRVKLLMALAAIVLCCVWGNIIFLAAVLVAIHVALLVDATPMRAIGRVWKYLLPFDLLVAIIWLLADHSGQDVLWQGAGIRISAQSLMTVAVVFLRIADVVWAALLMLLTTSQAKWINGLARLGVPFHAATKWARIIRWVPAFSAANVLTLREKQARGLSSRFGAYIHGWHATRKRMQWRDEQVDIAMRIRGSHMNRGTTPRTYYANVHMRMIDWVDLVLTIVVIAAVIVMIVFGW
ncbi:energy-coupling factor transporter transmembrane component T family protein [Bifidobacterium magnum]|uniref:ABC transporter, permease n=1 Tax=Bifidobacterium magnum TaxID=1692 RepID=A0A087BCD5_9BIFI|nr:energy-coupling factor transporter transmembrane component T [Bifidobacterium magnum]KFI68685.1 ABC transporter, permease [Bifidobacterium magnum]